jgi:EAL domain-containing protein (putative c-di-GMP-specific phosphodiesterase class I)
MPALPPNQGSATRVSDLALIVERDARSLAVLRAVLEQLGCERIEADSAAELSAILAIRSPTLAFLTLDTIEADGLAALKLLAAQGQRPATVLIGSVPERVLASARRAAYSLGVPIVGTLTRPLDEIRLEQLILSHITAMPLPSREELERALSEHELILKYQPKVSLAEARTRVCGAEALVRWQHPRRGTLLPRHFLSAFENYELAAALTDFVMTEAIRQAGLWRSRGLDLELVINLTPRLVRDRAFPERMRSVLKEHEVPPDRVVLDLTEATSGDDRDLLIDVFTRLRILGMGLSLDNFGTGLSSLTDLYRMPFSEIKVDSTLIREAAIEREAQIIVKAIADLAHALGLSVCAEGVESRAILEFVLATHFDSAQGRLFCGPADAADVEKLVTQWPAAAVPGIATWQAPAMGSEEEPSATRRIRALNLPLKR